MPANTVPTKLKVLRGTDQPCRTNPDEPVPSEEGVECPSDLTADEMKVWDRTLPLLQKVRVMTVNDVDALHLYCRHLVKLHDAMDRITKDGAVIECEETGAPVRKSPWFDVVTQEQKPVLDFMREFGLTPASRTKVSAVGKPKRGKGFDTL